MTNTPAPSNDRVIEDLRAAWGIASAVSDRFREIITECLGLDENPGDDELVRLLREHFGRTGPEPTRWRDLTGEIRQQYVVPGYSGDDDELVETDTTEDEFDRQWNEAADATEGVDDETTRRETAQREAGQVEVEPVGAVPPREFDSNDSGHSGEDTKTDKALSDRLLVTLTTHYVEASGSGEMVCAGCRRSHGETWMSTYAYYRHLADLLAAEVDKLRDEDVSNAMYLLERALHLRMRGEGASGGNETWDEFDAAVEMWLRARRTWLRARRTS